MINKIITSSIDIKFNNRDQANLCITWLINDSIDWHFELEKVYEHSLELWVVSVHDMPWSNNIKRLYKYLEKIDERA